MRAGNVTAWVPVSIAVLAKDILRTVRMAVKRCVSAGECLVITAAHFVLTWIAHWTKWQFRRAAGHHERQRCRVWGCSRPAGHEHHIVFRSQGGSDDPSNKIWLCATHHLHGIHAGRMRVTGTAPDKLVWEFGLRRSWAHTAVP